MPFPTPSAHGEVPSLSTELERKQLSLSTELRFRVVRKEKSLVVFAENLFC
jgi:hypothetical protein